MLANIVINYCNLTKLLEENLTNNSKSTEVTKLLIHINQVFISS